MFSGSVAGKVMQMEDAAMDMVADEELRKLEEKLGMATPAPVTPVEAGAEVNLDDELDQLEKRLQQGQGETGGAAPQG